MCDFGDFRSNHILYSHVTKVLELPYLGRVAGLLELSL